MKEFIPLLEKTTQVDDEFLARETDSMRVKATFIEGIGTQGRSNQPGFPRRAMFISTAMTCFAASVVAVAYLGFSMGQRSDSVNMPVGEWLRAPADKELPFEFGNGSRVVLSPGAVGRITEISGSKVVVLLEKGQARFFVAHQSDTDWRVNAGPYEVRVTGTVFSTSWQPDDAHFLLKVTEGEVEVFGPLVKDGNKVAANQMFSASVNDNKIELAAIVDDLQKTARLDTESDLGDSRVANDVQEQSNREIVTEKSTPALAKARLAPDSKDWKDAARRGNYMTAMKIVEKLELSSLFRKLNPDELFLLGDAARLTSRYKLAQQSYLTVRSRFPGTGHCTAAALALGRMAFDQLGNYRQASTWLEIYLNEGQGSNLTREILGRLMESEHKSGALEKARRTASKYMTSYPNGPHADLARVLLDE